MTIMERMLPVFRDIFDDPNLALTRATTARDVEGWDSLTHINLVVALEKQFNLKFTLTELKPLKNVGEMEDLIQRKLGESMNHYGFADLHLGLKHAFAVEVTEDMLDRFRALSGDVNPLHADDAYAVSRGYPKKVAFGMLTAAFYSTLVGVHLPGQNALLLEVDARFVAPVFPGDRLTVAGEITYLQEAYRHAEIKAAITNQDGRVVSKANIKVGLHV